ncbi:Na(+)/H(+) antiporter subunit D [Mariniblastus sp.]|nr:Na(+)/H(+) antiporter subunit D [Mariniblastus sp.]
MIAINTGLILIVGGLLLPLLGKQLSRFAAVAIAVVGLVWYLLLPDKATFPVELLGLKLMPLRVDDLSWIFGLIFHIAAVVSTLYALHVKDTKQHVAGLVYAGAAIVAALAGDLVTLFIAWELTAISSVVLIWASNNDSSYRAGVRYLIIQVGSGVLLLSGVVLHYVENDSVLFNHFMDLVPGDTASIYDYPLSAQLIFVAFGMKCAFPLLHNWLQDAYPKATVTGTVFLSAFTTKLAIYTLARGFHGTEELIWIGCTMTLFPIVFAVIENDLRRVLAYSLNNQLGFMVVGIGIGTELALNGTAAHAFCHIIYKALLFMSMGAVLYRVGTTKATELGGLHKSMPWTTVFCIIGGGAIAGFPLLSGFVSKSMIISAAGEEHMFWVWIVLLIASAGVMEHSGIKIPFFAFFAHDSGKRVKEAPWNMLLAMGIGATLCVGIGVWYTPLYACLPYELAHAYEPYTSGHVILQMQLLLFAALAFVVLMKTGLYPEEKRSENLDTDWAYRKAFPVLWTGARSLYGSADKAFRRGFVGLITAFIDRLNQSFNEQGTFGKTWSTSTMAFWSALFLGVFLVMYFLKGG